MLVSIITVCYNSEATIRTTLQSVAEQTYQEIEHIIIDGGSTDATLEIVKEFDHVARISSERDNGIYDAMNKGIKLATGDIVGILNSDDHFSSQEIVEGIIHRFDRSNIDALYADVQFVDESNQTVTRYYSSASWNIERFKYGFMPAHPSFYIKREYFNKLGYYKTNYKIAADFDLLLRFFSKGDLKYTYWEKPIVNMLEGGVSTQGLKSKYILSKEILRSCKENSIKSNWCYMIYRLGYKTVELILRK